MALQKENDALKCRNTDFHKRLEDRKKETEYSSIRTSTRNYNAFVTSRSAQLRQNENYHGKENDVAVVEERLPSSSLFVL